MSKHDKEFVLESVPAILNYINAATTAGCEEDVEPLLAMMRPTDDKAQMGDVYQNALGYNPITYFDEKYLSKKIDIIAKEAPSSIKSELLSRKDEIIETVMTHKENLDDDFLKTLLISTIESKLNWRPDDESEFNFYKVLEEELGDEFELMSEESFDDDDTDLSDDEDDDEEDDD